MTDPVGPGAPFELLFTQTDMTKESLPEAFRHFYPGDWHLQVPENRPYIYSNFATSRDGRISFNLPGQAAARYVTKSEPHDRWLMGLLRMRADAVLIGDGTIRAEGDYLCTAESIFPEDGAAFVKQRLSDGRGPRPLMIILSAEGHIPVDAACFRECDQHIVLATTHRGVARVQSIEHLGKKDVVAFDGDLVNPSQLVQILYERYNVRTLLCEGGANVFGTLLGAGLVDEEFLTWCPTFVGRDPSNFRPSYCEGVAWTPASAPYSKPISLHKSGDYFYLHTQNIPQSAANH